MAVCLCNYCTYITTSEPELLKHLLTCDKAVCLECGKTENHLGSVNANIIRVSNSNTQITIGAIIHPDCGSDASFYKLNRDSRLTFTVTSGMLSYTAQNILNFAEKGANRRGLNNIGTGVVLLALANCIPNPAGEIFNHLEVLRKIRKDLDETIQQNVEPGESGLTPFVKKAIELSIDEAKHLGFSKVGSEHILLGLLRQEDGFAAVELKKLDITIERVYMEIIKLYAKRLQGQLF